MNPHLLIVTVGLACIVVFGGISMLRREGISLQFMVEVLVLTLFVVSGDMLLGLVNMGIVQLRRDNPTSARDLLEAVLEEAGSGGLDVKSEAACRYNLGLAYQRLGDEAQAVHQFTQVIETFPSSIYGQEAERALEQRRDGGARE